MLKRRFVVLLAAMVLWCAPAQALTPTWDLVVAQLEQEMAMLAESRYYLKLIAGVSDGLISDRQADMAGYTWRQPLQTVYIGCDEEFLKLVLGITESELSSTLTGELISALTVSMVRSPKDAGAAILTNAMTTSVMYLDTTQPDGSMIFLRTYADGAPILFTVRAQQGAAIMTACALVDADELTQGDLTENLQARLDRYPGVALVSAERTVIAWPPFTADGTTAAQRAASLAQEMMRRMADPEYLSVYGLPEESQKVVAAWAKGDYADPVLTLYMGPDSFDLQPVMDDTMRIAMVENRATQRLMMRRMHEAFLNYVVSANITPEMHMAMNTTLTSAMYADLMYPEGSGTYLLFYEGGHAVQVSVWSEHGVVQMTARYLPLPELAACRTAEEASRWLSDALVPVVLTEIVN